MAELKTTYKDDIFTGNRKYNMVTNEDGTVSFTDATPYTQQGDYFGAGDVNSICEKVNTLEIIMPREPDDIDAAPQGHTHTSLNTTSKIDGVTFTGGYDITHYGFCSTGAGVSEKAVSIANVSAITSGLQVTVKFSASNTATNPTLNVNYTGAKPIYRGGAQVTGGTFTANTLYTFIYTGSYYEIVSTSFAGNSDTVDGQHVILADGLGLKPIQFSTTDLTAGTSALATGNIYIVYE